MAAEWLPGFALTQRKQPSKPDDGPPASDMRSQAASTEGSARPVTLMSLPAEIHVQIVQQLIYPDALSLKHTNRYFYNFVYTGVKLKVEWLMARRRLHLDCPNDTRCDLGSDLRFCRGSVPLLMKHRREHLECESRPGLGCLVYGTSTCTHRRPQHAIRRWFHRRFTVEIWWVLLALMPVVVSWVWFAELFRAYLV